MCRNMMHSPIHRNLCLCFAFYALFGVELHPGRFCSANTVLDTNLEKLFNSITNGSTINKEELHAFLKSVDLVPPKHLMKDHETHEEHGHSNNSHEEHDHSNHSHEEHDHSKHSHEEHDHSNHAHEEHDHSSHSHKEHDHSNHVHESQCYSAEEMLQFFPNKHQLNQSQLAVLLPTLMYELKTHACHHDHLEEKEKSEFGWKVILASLASVLVISVSGLIVVGLLPLMSRKFYNVASQFLIALAVGSLTGDAFVHLIPHALSADHDDHGHGSHGDAHHTMVTKSLVALLGIYAFFLTERLTILCQNSTARRKMKRQLSHQADLFNSEKDGAIATALTHGGGSYKRQDSFDSVAPVFFGTQNGDHSPMHMKTANNSSALPRLESQEDPTRLPTACDNNQLCNRPPKPPMDNTRCVDYLSTATNRDLSEGTNNFWPTSIQVNSEDVVSDKAPVSILSTSQSDSQSQTVNMRNGHVHSSAQLVPQGHQLGPNASQTCATSHTIFSDEIDEREPTHPHKDKPHGHHHGHSHDLSSVRAIAYTIIAGDGLHNFCDGIAIGAAFADSLRGGLSTSIAVLCHELPHELGDFAVLLHAGMSVKAALFYNLLSSILCAGGMALGLLLGRLASINSWLFMLTAGMFVYIALVDMMPELTTNRLKGHRFCHQPSVLFLWQNIGIILGFGVMLVIALFEDSML